MKKYCNICKTKTNSRFFKEHKEICIQRIQGKKLSIQCMTCNILHDGSFGSGVFCSNTCALKSRAKTKCSKCKKHISNCNYNHHLQACQGPKLNIEQWKTSENKYQCPECNLVFPKHGIKSHYVKIHGKITSSLIDTSVDIKPSKPTRTYTNCVICNNLLCGKQKKFCSINCKFASPRIKANGYASQKRRALNRKVKLINLKGGKCESCGYNKNLAALCFHHKDPNTKNFPLDSRSLSNINQKTLQKEADKCLLLCHNCHMEHHYPWFNS